MGILETIVGANFVRLMGPNTDRILVFVGECQAIDMFMLMGRIGKSELGFEGRSRALGTFLLSKKRREWLKL
jgi:hypothetical protein